MADWLRYASIQQGVAQPSGGFFSNPRTRQVSAELPWSSYRGICSQLPAVLGSQNQLLLGNGNLEVLLFSVTFCGVSGQDT